MTQDQDSPRKSNGDQATHSNETAPPTLNSYSGGPPPVLLREAWAIFRDFDEPLRDELAVLLNGLLDNPRDNANAGRFKAFCTHFNVEAETLSRVVEALNVMLGQAIAVGLGEDGLRADLDALDGEKTDLGDAIIGMYAAIQPELRARLIDETLADHGRLLVGVDWRVDELRVSDRGAGLDTSVMHLTLRYREGKETSRVTLQLVPEMARRLRDACARVVG